MWVHSVTLDRSLLSPIFSMHRSDRGRDWSRTLSFLLPLSPYIGSHWAKCCANQRNTSIKWWSVMSRGNLCIVERARLAGYRLRSQCGHCERQQGILGKLPASGKTRREGVLQGMVRGQRIRDVWKDRYRLWGYGIICYMSNRENTSYPLSNVIIILHPHISHHILDNRKWWNRRDSYKRLLVMK